MYKIRTNYGTTHQYIESWTEWDLDENFIKFKQQGNLLIIHKSQILTIYKQLFFILLVVICLARYKKEREDIPPN